MADSGNIVLSAAAVIPYEIIMIFGMAVIGCYWAAPFATPRRIPEALFAVLGLAVPCAGWLFSLFIPPVAVLLPLSFGWIYWIVSSDESAELAGQRRLMEEELAYSLRMIAEDSSNAVAYCSLAQICEKRGQPGLALDLYRRAHEADSRALPTPEFEDLASRLEPAARADSRKRRIPLRIPRVENVLFLVGLTYIYWNLSFAVNLCSVMLFIRWLRGDPRPGFGA